MNTRSLARPITLHRPLTSRLLDAVIERAREFLDRWRLRRAARAEIRLAEQAERELARLDPRTLQDIGAAEGLVGQRRWQEEHEAAQAARVLQLRGW